MSQPTKTEVGPDRASGQPADPLPANAGVTATRAAAAARAVTTDAVDAYGDDSFPASDPPGWWAGR